MNIEPNVSAHSKTEALLHLDNIRYPQGLSYFFWTTHSFGVENQRTKYATTALLNEFVG